MRRSIPLLFMSSVIGACGLSGVDPAAEPVADAQAPMPAMDPMEEMADKKMVKMPRNGRLDPIDWKTAFERQRVDARYANAKVRKARSDSGVPILVPNQPDLLDTLTVYGGEGWYVATLRADEHQLLIRGTRKAHSVDMSEADKLAMGKADELVLTRTMGIVTASFSLYGAAYNLEVECAKGPDAPACKDESTARGYVERLGLLGDAP